MTVLEARGLRPRGVDGAPLDLSLEAGTICCIVGPPQHGKAAWMRALSSVEPPAQGELRIGGEDVSTLDERGWRKLQQRVGYVGADPALLSVLSAGDNVTVAAHYHRLGDNAALREKAQHLLERLGWQGALDALPAYLNDWQRLLIALARCLMLDPLLLFVHDPFRKVDVAAARGFGTMLAGLSRERGVAQVIVTQHLPFVRRWANVILFAGSGGLSMHKGWTPFAASADPEVQDYLQAAAEGVRA